MQIVGGLTCCGGSCLLLCRGLFGSLSGSLSGSQFCGLLSSRLFGGLLLRKLFCRRLPVKVRDDHRVLTERTRDLAPRVFRHHANGLLAVRAGNSYFRHSVTVNNVVLSSYPHSNTARR